MANTAEQKILAIETLLKECSRLDEWDESALLNLVEKVISEPEMDLTPDGVKRLIDLY